MALRTNIWTAINALAKDKTVIWSNQNGPRPSGEYFTINAKSGRLVGSAVYGKVNGAGIMPVISDKEFTLSVERHGPGAFEELSEIKERLRTISSIDRLDALGMVAFDSSAVTDISELIGDVDMEERALLDVMIRVRSEILDDVGLIETLRLSGSDDGGRQYETRFIPIITQPE